MHQQQQQHKKDQERIAQPHHCRTPGSRTVFVGNLSDAVLESNLQQLLAACGDVRHIQWINNRQNRFKGCAFVSFADAHSCQQAVALNGTMVMGRPVRIDYARDQEQRPQNQDGRVYNSLFVGPVPKHITTHDLYRDFSCLGAIYEVRWLRDDRTNRYKNHAVIQYYEERSTHSAERRLGGSPYRGCDIRVQLGKPVHRRPDMDDDAWPGHAYTGQEMESRMTPTSPFQNGASLLPTIYDIPKTELPSDWLYKWLLNTDALASQTQAIMSAIQWQQQGQQPNYTMMDMSYPLTTVQTPLYQWGPTLI